MERARRRLMSLSPALAGMLVSVATAVALFPCAAHAMPPLFLMLPTGNQRDVDWKRLESAHFSVYHDARSPGVGRYALTAAENAYPDLSLLLGVKLGSDTQERTPFPKDFIRSRFDKVPLVVSTQVDGAAFANLTTQNIEVPVSTVTGESLYQHELTHRLMYEHFDPSVGVAGRAFSVAMLPTWWIEGLAEYMTESMGRLESAGVARAMALEDSYLSFERMHALYKASGDVFTRGYVTAGRMFGYLMQRMGNQDLSDVHKTFFWKTMTPPFVNAENRMIDGALGISPGDFYDEYVAREKKLWKEHLEGMPPAIGAKAHAWVVSGLTPNVLASDGEIMLSNLNGAPYGSALILNRGETVRTTETSEEKAQGDVDYGKMKGKRLRLSMEGSYHWDVHPAETEGGGFWTGDAESFKNGTFGYGFRYVAFRGRLDALNDDVVKVTDIPFSNASNPSRLVQIYSLGDGRAFALTDLRGRTSLVALNAARAKAVVVKSWDTPSRIRMAFKARSRKALVRDNCVTLVVDTDKERTSLERVCSNGQTTTLLPVGEQYLRDAVERADGSHTLLLGWNDGLGLAHLSGGKVTPIAAIPEWIERMAPWDEAGDVGLWKFDGYNQSLYRVNLNELGSKFQTWQQALPAGSVWRQGPRAVPFVAPFARYAAAKRAKLEAASAVATTADASAVPTPAVPTPAVPTAAVPAPAVQTLPVPTPMPSQSLEERGMVAKEEDATWRHNHWFTYPLVVPPPLSNWSLGVVSVPFNEEMERQRLQIYGTYNFYTQAPSGTIDYVNNRIFDGFNVSIFSRERFNGLYYYHDCKDDQCAVSPTRIRGSSYYLSTLREYGGGVATLHRFLPTSFALTLRLNLFRTQPLYGTKNDAIGAQNALVGQAGASLSAKLFEVNFYDRGNTTGGSWIDWTTTWNASADTYRTFGKVTTGGRRPTEELEFQKYDVGATSSVSYHDKVLSLRGSLSSTLGKRSFNLKETFSPYRTYLLGSGAGLNNLNLPIAGDSRLFSLREGTHSYRTSVDYSFPLISELDSQFYVFYFETLRGEAVVTRGGVAPGNELSQWTSVNSASAAVRLTIDVKGVQVFPSLAYGHIIGGDGWALFSELAFSQFF